MGSLRKGGQTCGKQGGLQAGYQLVGQLRTKYTSLFNLCLITAGTDHHADVYCLYLDLDALFGHACYNVE